MQVLYICVMGDHVVVIGAALIDELYFCTRETVLASSNPATMKKAAGGVARNIAHNLSLLGIPVKLFSVTGNDNDGRWLIESCKQAGINTDLFWQVDEITGKYASVLDTDGSLIVAACTDISEQYLTPAILQQRSKEFAKASMIIADANIAASSIGWLAAFCREHDIQLIIEPVSVAKSEKIAGLNLDGITMITPNEAELFSLCNKKHSGYAGAISELLQRGVQYIWLRKGPAGSELFSKEHSITLDTVPVVIKDSTGAGDAALAGWVAARFAGRNETESLKAAHSIALEVLQTDGAVAVHINKNNFPAIIKKYYPDEK